MKEKVANGGEEKLRPRKEKGDKGRVDRQRSCTGQAMGNKRLGILGGVLYYGMVAPSPARRNTAFCTHGKQHPDL
jgi:hypothetical protein